MFGGYVGFGLGVTNRWFSFFFRGRVEETVADGVPATFWPSGLIGIEFAVERALFSAWQAA